MLGSEATELVRLPEAGAPPYHTQGCFQQSYSWKLGPGAYKACALTAELSPWSPNLMYCFPCNHMWGFSMFSAFSSLLQLCLQVVSDLWYYKAHATHKIWYWNLDIFLIILFHLILRSRSRSKTQTWFNTFNTLPQICNIILMCTSEIEGSLWGLQDQGRSGIWTRIMRRSGTLHIANGWEPLG